jgi:hypothetical protein
MSSSDDTTDRTRRITYIVVGVVLVVLLVAALVAYGSARETAAAQEKADQLIAVISAAGLAPPSQDQVVRVLGDDGGAVCADPNSALKLAILHGQLTNGAAGPGIRPVIADNRAVKAELAILRIYCPDELSEFARTAADLKFADLVSG